MGDSILAGVLANHTLGQLQQALPGWDITFDAKADRNTAGGAAVVRAANPASFDVVIVGLGANNGWSATVFERQMRQVMDELAPVPRVYWLTVREVHRFAVEYQAVNAVIVKLANQYPNLQAVDWNTFGGQHPEAFYSDGLHLAPKGGVEMAAFLAEIVSGTNAYVVPRAAHAVTTTSSARTTTTTPTTTASSASAGAPAGSTGSRGVVGAAHAATPAAGAVVGSGGGGGGGAVGWWLGVAGVVVAAGASAGIARRRRPATARAGSHQLATAPAGSRRSATAPVAAATVRSDRDVRTDRDVRSDREVRSDRDGGAGPSGAGR